MLQRQMPAWLSHYLPDLYQAEDGKPSSPCALEVREQCWVGGAEAEGRRQAQGGLGAL